jgi:hypothetical protein
MHAKASKLCYYDTALITAVKSFVISVPEEDIETQKKLHFFHKLGMGLF